MANRDESRRDFLKTLGLAAGALAFFPAQYGCSRSQMGSPAQPGQSAVPANAAGPADYTLHIKTSPIEIAPDRIISATTYNGLFPGPLLRFKEGQRATVDVYNDTDAPEQLHWHGQKVPVDVDGAAEEGTPFIPAHGMRRSKAGAIASVCTMPVMTSIRFIFTGIALSWLAWGAGPLLES